MPFIQYYIEIKKVVIKIPLSLLYIKEINRDFI